MSWDFQQRVFWGQRVKLVTKSCLKIRFHFRNHLLHYIENFSGLETGLPQEKILSWICDFCLEGGKGSNTFFCPQRSTFSGILSFNPHSFLCNKYRPHFINHDLSVLFSEERECLASGRCRTPLINNLSSKTPYWPGWHFLRPRGGSSEIRCTIRWKLYIHDQTWTEPQGMSKLHKLVVCIPMLLTPASTCGHMGSGVQARIACGRKYRNGHEVWDFCIT